MGFKDIIQSDNKSVFINELEFADEHNLNDTICKAIIQNISVGESGLDKSDMISYSGVYGSRVQVNCLKEDLPEVPVSGQGFELDEIIYHVESCADDMGILTIQLVAYER